jgi:16S rRNA A1518/A1519 N6-dimethyltransferase RsmA/KsgA/DIM1 with predicted DNA glycosylase/AP lyase activity
VRVGREHFLPPPKVDSRVIKLTPKPRGDGAHNDVLLPDSADKDRFFQVHCLRK